MPGVQFRRVAGLTVSWTSEFYRQNRDVCSIFEAAPRFTRLDLGAFQKSVAKAKKVTKQSHVFLRATDEVLLASTVTPPMENVIMTLQEFFTSSRRVSVGMQSQTRARATA